MYKRQGKELLLTGEKITGKEAAEIGLITRSYPAEQLEEEAEKLADKLIKISPPALFVQKRGINKIFETAGLRTSLESCTVSRRCWSFFMSRSMVLRE